MSKPVTRKMVAEEAGVSETIVSYVVNNNRYVDKEKRRRVEEAIQRLGYQPNAIARSLKSRRSQHIIFIADQVNNEHFGNLISEMDSLLYNKGYLISLAQNRDADEFIQHIISRQFDGIIISSVSMREAHICALAAAGIPVVVLMNRSYNNLPSHIGKIYPGLYDGARECVRHLYEMGSREIIYIDRMSSRGHFSGLSDLRLKGFLDELAALKLQFDTDRIITECENEGDVAAKITTRIKSGLPVDAVFARNDNMAAIAIRALRELNLRIPQDVKVAGFDNSNMSRHIVPSLTTVEIDRKGTAQAAVGLLRDMIDKQPISPVELKTNLVIRESTKK